MILEARRLIQLAVHSAVATILVATAFAGVLHAQTTPPVVPPKIFPPPPPLDTSKKTVVEPRSLPPDTIKKRLPGDTTPAPLLRDQTLIQWDPPDSTMLELNARKGLRRVQYQGDTVRYDAKTGLLHLTGKPSAVQRDETMLVGDTIIYSDSAKTILAKGDTVTLRDPSQKDADDMKVHGFINYDLESRSGTVGRFETSVESGGQRLFIDAKGGEIFADTAVAGSHIVVASDGSFTYCDLVEPHFHFTTKQMKFISQNVMVARPGILYIGEVPVFWIPFFFQDVRSGRRSGLLTPSFGIAELLRNSPSYRRQLNNMGYFFALNDYMDAELSFDWRSDANSIAGDRGFIRTNAEYRYRWIDRFTQGRLAVERLVYASGDKNLSVSLNHSQDFSKATRLTANLNWTQDTRIQQATTTNPFAATATILSQMNYQTKIGPAAIQLGGTRRQFPGRTEVDMDFPNVTFSTGTLAAGPIRWTPSGSVHISSVTGKDQGLQYPFSYSARADGGTDSSRINAKTRNMSADFQTPLTIFGFQWQNSFSIRDELRDYPEQLKLTNVHNPADTVTRIYAQQFRTSVDWNTSFSLPGFLRGTFNITPTVSFNNVDGSDGLFVRNTRSGGDWVGQGKRASYGLSMAPTFFAMLPGIGPIARFRHSVSPSFTYSYSPAATVSDDYLSATGHTRAGYIGALAQNRLGMGLSTNLEGKLRAKSDTGAPSAAIQLLSLNFSSLTWDFIRADTAGTGLVESNFNIGARSALLPGLDFRMGYSLFQGDPLSDSAVFKPYRTDIGATFSLNGQSGILAVIGKLFGLKGGNLEDALPGTTRKPNVADDVIAQQVDQMTAAGSRRRTSVPPITNGRGWSLNLQYNSARTRPPIGGTVIINNPESQCAAFKAQGDAIYQTCLLQAISNPQNGADTTRIGSPIFLSPPTQNVASNLTFNITRNWSAQWSTSYDVERKRFATQQVGLQRQLHDWTTTFSFNQSPNGAFSFNFFIALKAQPSLKFNYDRATYRSGAGL